MSVERLTKFSTSDGGEVYVDYRSVVEVRLGSKGGVVVLDNGSAHATDVSVPLAYEALLNQKRSVESAYNIEAGLEDAHNKIHELQVMVDFWRRRACDVGADPLEDRGSRDE